MSPVICQHFLYLVTGTRNTPYKLAVKTFMIHQKSAKTTKVFSRVAFVIYGNLIIARPALYYQFLTLIHPR